MKNFHQKIKVPYYSEGKFLRIVLAMLLPVLLAAFLCTFVYGMNNFVSGGFNDLNTIDFIGMFIVISFVGYIFMGIQSIIYALLLEYLVNQKIKNNIIAVATSTILGIASGMSLIFLDEDAPMPIVGTTVGLIVGIIIRFMYLRAQKIQIDR